MLLITMDPQAIVDFYARHPLDLKESYRFQTVRRGAGDILSPTPAADVFFTLLHARKGQLFTQGDFAEYCMHAAWEDWSARLDPWVKDCFIARIYRNFFPSFIDSLHVWALLGTRYTVKGQLVFDRCLIDTFADVITKVDLLLYRQEACQKLALTVNTSAAWQDNQYKDTHRGPRDAETITLRMRVGRSYRGAGNKCWFHYPRDFQPLFRRVEQLWFPFTKDA